MDIGSALGAIAGKYADKMGKAGLTADQKFQLDLQKEAEMNALISNVLKTLHDSAMAVINNCKA